MTVEELIKILSVCDPKSKIIINIPRAWVKKQPDKKFVNLLSVRIPQSDVVNPWCVEIETCDWPI